MLKMIVSNLQPLSIVEDTSFRDFVDALKPTAALPNETASMHAELLCVYNQEKEVVNQYLEAAKDIVLTCEMWHSRAEDPYLTVGCHVVNRYGNLKSFVLQTTSFFDDPHAAQVKEHLFSVTDAWGIKEKVHAVVTTGVPNAKDAFVGSKWVHMPCFAGTLDTVFKNVLKADPDLEKTLRKYKIIGTFFNSHPDAEQKLREMQDRLGCAKKSLIHSVGDGWLPTLLMVERIEEQCEAMAGVFAQKGRNDLTPTDEERKKTKDFIAAFLSLKETTDMMGKKGFETISVVIPLLRRLMDVLEEKIGRHNKVAIRLVLECNKCFGDLKSHRLNHYTLLDPRFKNIILNDHDTFKKKQNLFATIGSKLASNSPAQESDYNLTEYMAVKPIAREANPLSWWTYTGSALSEELSREALKKLGVVSTAVPLERAFSKAGDLFCRRRCCLEPEHINMILFLHSNWQ